MRLTKIYVRFYKSFNYDYERKFARTSEPDPWELLDGAWYPYVRMHVEPSITTIVGANESGKSHLLDAAEKLITGKGIDRSDFCRYSHFFSVEQGKRRSPDFGGEFEVVDSHDVERALKHLDLELAVGDRFHLFRPNGEGPVVYQSGKNQPIPVTAKQSSLALALPAVFRLDAHVPLPASIPLYELAADAKRPHGSRRSRWAVFEGFLGKSWSDASDFTKAAPSLYGLLSDGTSRGDVDDLEQQYELGRSLLFRVANIDPTTFKDLSDAIADEREGYVNGVIQKINGALARHLNFPRWWAQDREFRLMVSPREYELVFTIRDRTGTDYSFAERSNGLKFFLSYHVQLLAHQPPATGQPEILLMDEPDAYLSSQGQQDLLRILEEFALPEDRSRLDQVLYVTHSPFLINRNAGERIRVLDKGVTDEGTRVVRDVARNHYEPLRSSLGAFVAETSFIGGSNLFVEGLADQVLLAGVSSHLLAYGAPKIDLLDLNSVTIVPAGSASSVPYLVYLARGRDVVRPPCVALLDSDSAGDDAVKTLARGGPRRKEVLPSEFVIQIGSWAKTAEQLSIADRVTVTELEDLVSLPVAVAAARNYAVKVVEIPRASAEQLVEADVAAQLKAHPGPLFDALALAFAERLGPDVHIEKVGFAKEVVAALAASRSVETPLPGFAEVERNIGLLLSALAKLLRRAYQREEDRRLSNRLNRTIAGFLADYPTPTTRERGRLLIEEVNASVETSDEGDRVRLLAAKLYRDFELDEDLTKPIDRYEEFRERVEALRYEERLTKQDPKVVVEQPTTKDDVAKRADASAE
jgi:hypothetical protein